MSCDTLLAKHFKNIRPTTQCPIFTVDTENIGIVTYEKKLTTFFDVMHQRKENLFAKFRNEVCAHLRNYSPPTFSQTFENVSASYNGPMPLQKTKVVTLQPRQTFKALSALVHSPFISIQNRWAGQTPLLSLS